MAIKCIKRSSTHQESKTMRKPLVPRTTLLISTLALFAVLLGNTPLRANAAEDFPKPTFNDNGELLRPAVSYREWVYVGTPLTPNDLNPPAANFPEFHNVYIHPRDFDHWKKTGRFPDGTVLVKELVTVGAT
jgi:hypothetical protein